MPYAQSDGARIYYEETGRGTPILFVHEFAGDHRSWEDQMRHFGRGWRGITWGARGYPPSDCPADEKLYGQAFFERDAIAVLDAAKVEKAHIVGLSMGGYTALMLAAQASRARDLLHGRRRRLGRAQEHAGAVHRGMPQPGRRLRARRQDRRRDHEPGTDPRAAAEQGPDRLAPLRRASGRAPGRRRRQDAAHRAVGPALPLRSGSRAESHPGAGAAAGRRRGRAVPGRQSMDEAADADRRASPCCRAPATPSTWRSRRCSIS